MLPQENIKVVKTLELNGDYYSLTFYGQYLDTDDEDLNTFNTAKDRKFVRKQSKRKNSIVPPTREEQIEMKRLWALDIKRKLREKRNVKNFFKLI